MNRVIENLGVLSGAGVVSPAGWGMAPFGEALEAGLPLPDEPLEHSGERGFARVRRVPPQPKELRVKSPRLRRASPLTRFLVAAVGEAVGSAGGGSRVGLVVALMNGCVNYTNRFFSEVLDDPAQASPLVFPETVFNAPASHVATVLGTGGPVTTLLGDPAVLGEALRTAALWNALGETDACIVACAEEADWLSAEGLAYYGRGFVACEGAAAFVLAPGGAGIPLASLEQAAYTGGAGRRQALGSLGETPSPVRRVFGYGMGTAAGFELAAAHSRCLVGGAGEVSTVFSGTNASAYKVTLGASVTDHA